MNLQLRDFVKSVFSSFGLDLRRSSRSSSTSSQALAALQHIAANIVFDIGANVGQFSRQLRAAGYTGKIVSFEPLTDAHAKLLRHSCNDDLWIVHSRGALGDHTGEIEINVSQNSVSSSVLPMLDTHLKAANNSSYVSSEICPISVLDDIAPLYLSFDRNLFIKIDTQGFERQVLQGGLITLKETSGVLLELSLVPLYEGQALWLDMIEFLQAQGFNLWSIQPGFCDPSTGRTLQIDAIFMRC